VRPAKNKHCYAKHPNELEYDLQDTNIAVQKICRIPQRFRQETPPADSPRELPAITTYRIHIYIHTFARLPAKIGTSDYPEKNNLNSTSLLLRERIVKTGQQVSCSLF
jgi:hypothetical protein